MALQEGWVNVSEVDGSPAYCNCFITSICQYLHVVANIKELQNETEGFELSGIYFKCSLQFHSVSSDWRPMFR